MIIHAKGEYETAEQMLRELLAKSQALSAMKCQVPLSTASNLGVVRRDQGK
jgi:hypothetical protein